MQRRKKTSRLKDGEGGVSVENISERKHVGGGRIEGRHVIGAGL